MIAALSVQPLTWSAPQCELTMAFELFKKTGKRVDAAAIVLIPAQGRLGINSPACELLRGAKVEAVFLLWDRATHTIALKAAKKVTSTLTQSLTTRMGIQPRLAVQHFCGGLVGPEVSEQQLSPNGMRMKSD
jgi:hypothetical protein